MRRVHTSTSTRTRTCTVIAHVPAPSTCTRICTVLIDLDSVGGTEQRTPAAACCDRVFSAQTNNQQMTLTNIESGPLVLPGITHEILEVSSETTEPPNPTAFSTIDHHPREASQTHSFTDTTTVRDRVPLSAPVLNALAACAKLNVCAPPPCKAAKGLVQLITLFKGPRTVPPGLIPHPTGPVQGVARSPNMVTEAGLRMKCIRTLPQDFPPQMFRQPVLLQADRTRLPH
jgi:hypothetical protein